MIRLRATRSEDGSALILALVFLSLFGIFVSVLLSFADTSFRTTLALRDQGSTVYGADGAVQGAINYVRGHYPCGKDPAAGGTCPSFAPPATNGVAVTVTCAGATGSGIGTGANPSSKPAQAILTLSSGAEDGIYHAANNTLNIHGGIRSNTTIVATGGSNSLVAVDGDVTAVGACTPLKVTTTFPPLHCSGGAGSAGADPNYAAAISTAPPLNTSLPTCGASWLVQFTPNQTYDDAVGLTALMGGGACAGKVMYFPPGNYYFDFRRPAVSHVWTIGDQNVNVIGGTPRGWSTGAATKPAIITAGASGLCKTDQDATPNDGVQFIFGGDSQILDNAGTVELCAQPSTTTQQIGIYGLKSGAASTTANMTPNAASGITAFATTPSHSPVGYGAFAAADGYTEHVKLNTQGSNNTSTAQETLSGYSGIPSDAVVTGAVLHVVHSESDTTSSDYSTAPTATLNSGILTQPCSFGVHAALTDDTCNVLATFLTPSALNALTTTYAVAIKNNNTSTVDLDAVYVAVTYIPLALRAESGCITLAPYPATAGSCALVKVTQTGTTFIIQGTVYAPLAPIDVAMTNASTQIFGRGLVARTLQTRITPSTQYTGPTINVPSDAVIADRTVVFTATDSTGKVLLRAVVRFFDNLGANPGQEVHVTSWSVFR